MSNIRSKSSAYVNSLVGFTRDTKPYHSKLTEIAIEYRFDESMNVRIEDAVASQMIAKAGWLYSFFSGGEGALRSMPLQRVVTPHPVYAAATNADMANVPHVFAKKNTIGYGDVKRVRGSQSVTFSRNSDFFHNYGSCELRVSLPEANDQDQTPRWQLTNAENVMSTVTAATQQLALDITNPSSANRRIRDILLQIQARLVTFPNAAATLALNDLLAIINTPGLPRSYEALLNQLVAGNTPVILGYAGWIGEDGSPVSSKYVDDALSQLTPPAYFNTLSDMRLREGSRVSYPNVVTGVGFTVTNAQSVTFDQPEEWTVRVSELSPLVVEVIGSSHGYIGATVVGNTFTSDFVTFDTVLSAGTPVLGSTVYLTPITRLAVAAGSPTQVWNLIKTDPLAHDRPVFASPRFGSIQNLSGTQGLVTILDGTIPSGTIILTATSTTTFALTSTIEPSYTGTATVGTTFNDGRIGFRIVAGSGQPFAVGDAFFVNIVNNPAQAVELDMYFGYDLDSYDNMTSGYGAGQPFEFRYDSRFVDYDLSTLNLFIAENAVPGRRFKLTALTSGAPISTLKKDGSGPSNSVDLTEPTSGVSPDPALNSVPVFSMPSDANTAPDLQVFYANSFRLEYSDNNFTTSTFVANVPVNGAFADAGLGVSFSLPEGSKPFIAVSADDGVGSPRVEGGDVLMFRIVNDPPVLNPSPVAFSSPNTATLQMHSDGFWDAPDANWTVAFTSPTDYTVNAIYTTGILAGTTVAGYPVAGSLLTTGTGVFQNLTYKDDLVHFTIKQGAIGFVAGDLFTFKTFLRKPSILVYGSNSGWQADAVIGEWYFNGHIGFKIGLPKVDIFQGTNHLDVADADFNKIAVTRVRPDTNSLVYTFTRLAASYIVNRSDVGIVGYAPTTGTFKDKFITVNLTNPAATFTVMVTADELPFWNAEDTIVVRPSIAALVPQPGDVVTVQKAEEGRLGISLNYDQVLTPPALSNLFPLGIDEAFVDTDTGSASPPIEKYSPEARVNNGWLPLTVEGTDAINSTAFFPDEATGFTVRSAATNQLVGKVFSLGNINEPMRFEWDQTFFDEYMPLNTQARVMTYGTHLDESVKVSMSERLNFMVSGGVLLEDALFNDAVNVNIDEAHAWDMLMAQAEAANVSVQDSPFAGFLPGFANLPYDAEDALGLNIGQLTAALGRFDTGNPLVDHYLRAAFLATVVAPTPDEQQELADLLGLVADYLQPGGISATTLVQFLTALNADVFTPTIAPEMGIPARGLAIDIDKTSTDGASASFATTASVFMAANLSTMDTEGFDTDGLDNIDEATVYLISTSGLPVPVSPNFSSYAALDTPLFTAQAARHFILSFPVSIATTPTVQVWQLGSTSAITVPVVNRLSSRTFSFSVSGATEAKVVVT